MKKELRNVRFILVIVDDGVANERTKGREEDDDSNDEDHNEGDH